MFYVLNFDNHQFISCDKTLDVEDQINKLLEQGISEDSIEVLNGFVEDIRLGVNEFRDMFKNELETEKSSVKEKLSYEYDNYMLHKLLFDVTTKNSTPNPYHVGAWSITFNGIDNISDFQLYYNNTCVLNCNTFGKQLQIVNDSIYPLKDLIPVVEDVLSHLDYHFDVKLELLMPIDFNENWTMDYENAKFDRIIEEYRPDDIENGYDLVLFSIPNLSELKNVILTKEDDEPFCIEDYEVGMDYKDCSVRIYPTSYLPYKEEKLSLEEQIKEAAEQKINSGQKDSKEIEQEL